MNLVKRINDAILKYGGSVLSTIQYPQNTIQKSSYRKTALTATAILALMAAKARPVPVYDDKDLTIPIQSQLTTPTKTLSDTFVKSVPMYGDWDVWVQSQLTTPTETLSDTFRAGVKEGASDGYDALYDAMQLNPPGEGILLFSIREYTLTCDIRPPLEELFDSETWEMTLVAADPLYFQGFSGTNNISWDISEVLPNIELTLIDYNMDATRTFPVNTIDISTLNNYYFYVNNALGPYRYMDFRAELIPEPSTFALLVLGALALLRRDQYKKHQ